MGGSVTLDAVRSRQTEEETPVVANTETSEVWLGMFVPPRCGLQRVRGALQTDASPNKGRGRRRR